MAAPVHPRQLIVVDSNGVERYQGNSIVKYITEHGGFDPGHLDMLDFPLPDRIQYAQLLGLPVDEVWQKMKVIV